MQDLQNAQPKFQLLPPNPTKRAKANKSLIHIGVERAKTKSYDKSGIRTHASCETRKLLLVVELRYTLTWRLRPTRPSYQYDERLMGIWLHERKLTITIMDLK